MLIISSIKSSVFVLCNLQKPLLNLLNYMWHDPFFQEYAPKQVFSREFSCSSTMVFKVMILFLNARLKIHSKNRKFRLFLLENTGYSLKICESFQIFFNYALIFRCFCPAPICYPIAMASFLLFSIFNLNSNGVKYSKLECGRSVL